MLNHHLIVNILCTSCRKESKRRLEKLQSNKYTTKNFYSKNLISITITSHVKSMKKIQTCPIEGNLFSE